jgi:ATP-dependent DNA helicase RecG
MCRGPWEKRNVTSQRRYDAFMAPVDAHSRRQAALDALNAVASGVKACDVESEGVDFKEEAGTVGRGGKRDPIDPEHEPAAKALAEEVACMAMSDQGGVIVVGVNDKESGKAAFVGSHLDLDWLRRRIHALTQPNLSIDFPEEVMKGGKRLYLINVPPTLSEIRSGGKLRGRQGTDCVELDGDRAREFLERRRSYDWSAEASSEHFSKCDPDALLSAHRHHAARHGVPAGSDLELLRRLGVLMDDGEDPQLNQAGAVLLCAYEPSVERLDVRVVDVEGAVSSDRATLKAPVLTAFDEAWKKIERAFPAHPIIIGAQRRDERPIDQRALREALVNAIMHRDYRMPRASIIAMLIGSPADTFKVASPGGFPEGVDKDRLLAARSLPRNRALADAMRALGLAEREGVGIGVMHLAMLRDGHPAPEIYPDAGDVICRLHGGSVDRDVRGFFDGLVASDEHFEEDVRSHIAITELLTRTPLRVEALARAAQCSPGEALAVLERLAASGAVERLLNRSHSFRLTKQSRNALRSRISYRRRTTADDQWDLVRAFLDVEDEIGRQDASALLAVSEGRASRVLSNLHKDEKIQLVRSARGRGVRYKLVR